MEEELGECEVRGAYEELRGTRRGVYPAQGAVGRTRVRKQQAGGWRQEAAGEVVRAREVVLPWVHVWSTMMSDRFRSVHFTRRSSYYATLTKPDLEGGGYTGRRGGAVLFTLFGTAF